MLENGAFAIFSNSKFLIILCLLLLYSPIY